MSDNPYMVLGLSPDASEDEIKKKYRALVKQYHPDLHPNDEEAARKMSEINAAYEQIKSGNVNPTGGYSDGYGSQSAPRGTYTRNNTTYYYQYADFEDVLKSFFGGFGFNGAGGYDAAEAYERIDNYLNYGDYNNAAQILNRINIRDGKWYYYASKISEGMGNYTDALNFSAQAVRADSSSTVYREQYNQMNKSYGRAIRRRRFFSKALSFIIMLMVLSFVGRMFSSLFFWFL